VFRAVETKQAVSSTIGKIHIRSTELYNQISLKIWPFQTARGARTDRFLGSDLIKILCLAKVRFDPLYGLDLIIEDVDPSYTLGDLAAKLARIREKLQQTGLYERNK